MLELLESVESLESKVDNTVPEFRKEISRLEFNMAQLTSTVSIAREDQVRLLCIDGHKIWSGEAGI